MKLNKVLALILSLGGFCINGAKADCASVFSAVPRPHLIILSAPSGGGKTTLAQMLIKDYKNLKLSVSSTTRAPRGAEINGVDYHFLDKAQFKAKIDKGEFAEWAEVHGNYYGTDATVIKSAFGLGQSVMALIDIKGAEQIRKSFPGEVYTIFISPPDLKTLEQRLRARGTDSEEAIALRLKNAKAEMAESSRYDQVVINDKLDEAYNRLKQIILDKGLIAKP